MKQNCMHFIGIRTTIENHFLVKKKKGWNGIGPKAVEHLLELAKCAAWLPEDKCCLYLVRD